MWQGSSEGLERTTHNREVRGSIPRPATSFLYFIFFLKGCKSSCLRYSNSLKKEVAMSDEINELKARIARLEAERAVQSTFNEYLYNLDIGYTEGIMDVFTADAHLEVVNFPPGTMKNLDFRGRDEIRPLYADHSAHEPHLSGGHHACNIAINVALDCSKAELSAYFMTSGGRPSIGGGMYQGTFRDDGDKWRMTEYRIMSNWGWSAGSDAKSNTDSLPASVAQRDGRPPVYDRQGS